jgi:hypothetical protein
MLASMSQPSKPLGAGRSRAADANRDQRGLSVFLKVESESVVVDEP